MVIDGPRQSETWQSVDRKYIPKQDKELAPKGVVISEFYNEGITLTVPGHVAITTGKYETIGNKGEQVPTEPSFLQLWLKISNAAKDKAWIVTSKDKLNVLANCNKLQWRNAYNPSVDAVFREDVKTFDAAKEILQKHNPRLMLLHFRGPDSAGHAGDWDDYVQNIAIADSLLYELWNFIETDEFYACI